MIQSNENIRACPFCGNATLINFKGKKVQIVGDVRFRGIAECFICHAEAKSEFLYQSEEDAVRDVKEIWNGKLIKRLGEML